MKIKIIILNIILIVIFYFLLDFFIYKIGVSSFLKENQNAQNIPQFGYTLKNPNIPYTDTEVYFSGEDNIYKGRKPDGLQYKNKESLTIFGCSYALGQYLKPNQTFSYKLSNLLKRPVYNRAISGAGLQHMFFQADNNKFFYKDVPPSDTVFYVMIGDHYLRMSIFSDFSPESRNTHLRYTIKNNKLIIDNYNNYILNFFKASYLVKYINLKFLDSYLKQDKHADKITDTALQYFIETREKLEKNWNKKIKFVVIFYEGWEKIKFRPILKRKLEDNGFIVLDTDDLTKEDLKSEKYLMQDNLHPKESAWDLLTPIIVKKLQLK